jgi:hypothetical protein
VARKPVCEPFILNSRMNIQEIPLDSFTNYEEPADDTLLSTLSSHVQPLSETSTESGHYPDGTEFTFSHVQPFSVNSCDSLVTQIGALAAAPPPLGAALVGLNPPSIEGGDGGL